jgi:hypothetical protein
MEPARALAGLCRQRDKWGWMIGVGLEYAFADNWSGKTEYRRRRPPKWTAFAFCRDPRREFGQGVAQLPYLAENPSDSVAYSRSNDRLGALRISQRTSAN